MDPAQAQLHVLTGHRRDLVEQHVRTLMRMQAVLSTINPALAGVLDLTLRGPVHILAHWQTPATIRRAGTEQIHALRRQYKVNNGRQLTAAVITAARGQTIRTAGEATNAAVVGQPALDLQDVNGRIDAADAQIAEALTGHPPAEIVQRTPGMRPIRPAEFLAHAGKPDTTPHRRGWRRTPGSPLSTETPA